MYKTIYVPVDNSEGSNTAIDLAVALGKAFGSDLVGSHVYATRMHDYRFRQMEYTLPPEYQHEEELEKQRRIHDSLITMGLQLISDSYLEVMTQKAPVKPRDHTDADYMGKLTAQQIFNTIKQGGEAVGKSPFMPKWGGILSDQQIEDIVVYIRTLSGSSK
jgi:nucleotide-binding universal stress UspA family protein